MALRSAVGVGAEIFNNRDGGHGLLLACSRADSIVDEALGVLRDLTGQLGRERGGIEPELVADADGGGGGPCGPCIETKPVRDELTLGGDISAGLALSHLPKVGQRQMRCRIAAAHDRGNLADPPAIGDKATTAVYGSALVAHLDNGRADAECDGQFILEHRIYLHGARVLSEQDSPDQLFALNPC